MNEEDSAEKTKRCEQYPTNVRDTRAELLFDIRNGVAEQRLIHARQTPAQQAHRKNGDRIAAELTPRARRS